LTHEEKAELKMVEIQEKEKELNRLFHKIERNYKKMDDKARTLPND